MPRRVRCRCGQELIVRHGEGLYVAFLLLFLALLGSVAGVVVLFGNLGRIEETVEDLERELASRPLPPPDRAARRVAQRHEEAKQPAPLPEKERSPPRPPEQAKPGEAKPGETRPRQGESIRIARGSPGESAVQELLDELEILPATRDEVDPAPDPLTASLRVLAAPRLIRYLLLRSHRVDLGLNIAALADPDDIVRQTAITQTLSHPTIAGKKTYRPTPGQAALLRSAASMLQGEAAGRRLFEKLDLSGGTKLNDEESRRWIDHANHLLMSLPDRSLQPFLEDIEVRGLDILFAIDTTESMEESLSSIQRTAAWLLPAMEWSFPGLRVALILYKDEVVERIAFSEHPSKEVLPRLLRARAVGGGDVPEGVYTAFAEALQLGHFAWRPDAVKHIVIVGDQPPRHEEKRAFESLAVASHRDGKFHLHTLGMNPTEGRVDIPYFSDFARAGGGRSATCDKSNIASETLTCLLPPENRERAETLAGILRVLFGGG